MFASEWSNESLLLIKAKKKEEKKKEKKIKKWEILMRIYFLCFVKREKDDLNLQISIRDFNNQVNKDMTVS